MAHYLGEIYRLGGEMGLIPPAGLAAVMQVSRPVVSRMIGRLETTGMVENEPYQGVRLTESCVEQALREIRYHRMAEAADDVFVGRMARLAGHSSP